MPLASGATFAGYSILRLLGASMLGEVYLAQHPRFPRWNALKILSATLTEDLEFHARFLRETSIATTLYHPHIVEIHYRGESDGLLWVATDYVNGTSGRQLMAHRCPKGMPASEVSATITPVADALDYAHNRGMLHRAVKPANILFATPAGGQPQILLTDFGIAQQLGNPDGASAPDLTGERVAYVAPEQLTDSDADGRADQYALAATAFHLLTGAPPFRQSNPIAIMSQHLTAAPPRLSDRRPEIACLDDVFSTALAKNPVDRFGSCRSFADALRQRAGAWTSDRSPEAYLTIVDYPDDEVVETPHETAAPSSSTQSSFPAWTTTVQQHVTTTASATAGESPAPVRRRWPWILALSTVTGVALCVGLLAFGIMIGRRYDTNSTQAASPPTSTQVSAPAATPTTSTRNVPGPGEALDGSYRFDVNRAQQTYNDTPDPQPPNVSTWWAFHTSCTPASCVATGILLDDVDHQRVSAKGGDKPLVLDFRDGAWQSRPETVLFACVGPNGTSAKQTTTQAIRLQRAHGALRGTMTVTVESNECAQQGAAIHIPAVASRVGDPPPGVEVPAPSTTTSTTLTATSTPGR
jgi:serine/threonine protein kinase, bacterial